MIKRIGAFGAAVMVAASVMAANLDEGTHEIQASGHWDTDTAAGESFEIAGGYGYFILDALEVGGRLGYADDDLSSLWVGSVFTEYNFIIEDIAVVPFVGAQLGAANLNPDDGDSTEAFVIGVSGGVKYFITEDLAIAAQINFEKSSDDIYFEEQQLSDDNVDVTLGLRYYFDTVGTTAH